MTARATATSPDFISVRESVSTDILATETASPLTQVGKDKIGQGHRWSVKQLSMDTDGQGDLGC